MNTIKNAYISIQFKVALNSFNLQYPNYKSEPYMKSGCKILSDRPREFILGHWNLTASMLQPVDRTLMTKW